MGYADDYGKALEKLDDQLYMRSGHAGQGDKFSEVPTDQAFLERLNEQRETRKLDEIKSRNRMAVKSARKKKNLKKDKNRIEESLNHYLRKRKNCRLPSPTNKTEWISISRAIDLIRNGADAYETDIRRVCYIVTRENEIFYFHCSSGYREKIKFAQKLQDY